MQHGTVIYRTANNDLKKPGTNPNSQGNKRFKFMISVFRWWLSKWRNCGSSSNFYIPHYFFGVPILIIGI